MKSKLKVFICTHFLNHDLLPLIFLTPIYSSIGCYNKKLQTTYHDSNGLNPIDKFNPYINEMTAIYFIINNFDTLDIPEYIGFMHYRRYLPFNINDLLPMNIICSKWHFNDNTILLDLYHWHHEISSINEFMQLLPDNIEPSKSFIYKHLIFDKEFHNFNMFIMHKSTFKLYAKFIRTCIDTAIILINRNKNLLNNVSKYQLRFYGFILERMTSAFIEYMKSDKNYKLLENKIIHFNIKNNINGVC